MCLSYPGKIISIAGDQAVVDFDGIVKNVNVSLVKNAKKGDYVMVHAGFAIQKLGKESAWEVLKIYEAAGKSKKK